MVNYTVANITSLPQAYDYAGSVFAQGVGLNYVPPMILGAIFLAFLVGSSKYTQERAIMFSSFMATIAAFLMVSGGFLNPGFLIIMFLIFMGSVLFARLGG